MRRRSAARRSIPASMRCRRRARGFAWSRPVRRAPGWEPRRRRLVGGRRCRVRRRHGCGDRRWRPWAGVAARRLGGRRRVSETGVGCGGGVGAGAADGGPGVGRCAGGAGGSAGVARVLGSRCRVRWWCGGAGVWRWRGCGDRRGRSLARLAARRRRRLGVRWGTAPLGCCCGRRGCGRARALTAARSRLVAVMPVWGAVVRCGGAGVWWWRGCGDRRGRSSARLAARRRRRLGVRWRTAPLGCCCGRRGCGRARACRRLGAGWSRCCRCGVRWWCGGAGVWRWRGCGDRRWRSSARLAARRRRRLGVRRRTAPLGCAAAGGDAAALVEAG